MFYSEYLAKRTIVLAALERENKLDLISTNRIVTDLRLFFEQINSGNIEEAWSLITKLDILPTSKVELSTKVRRYEELDPIVKRAFPSVLRGAMECLYSQHRRVKAESHGITPTVKSLLSELQELARLLHTFAGLANVPSDLRDSMSRLEAHMI